MRGDRHPMVCMREPWLTDRYVGGCAELTHSPDASTGSLNHQFRAPENMLI